MDAFKRYGDELKATEIDNQVGEDPDNEYYIKFPIITVCENYFQNTGHSFMQKSNICYRNTSLPIIQKLKSCLETRNDLVIEDILKNISINPQDIFYDVIAYIGHQQIVLKTNWTAVYHKIHGFCFSLDLSKSKISDLSLKASTLTLTRKCHIQLPCERFCIETVVNCFFP